MDTIPEVVPPLSRKVDWNRNLSGSDPFEWLGKGWADFKIVPHISISYGLIVFIVSALFIAILFSLQVDYILFPAIAGFMITGPALAIGLYTKSRLIFEGQSVSLAKTLPGWDRSDGQVAFIGVLLLLLILLWMRAAVLIYALFSACYRFKGLNILPRRC